MCGIAGIVDVTGRPVDGALVRAMTTAIAHRGPDGDAVVCHGGTGLGHRRLAIIDLVTGDQPMASEDGLVRIIFNGEIYNFRELRGELEARGARFHTASDTEVILRAYEADGPDCVRRLRGMFAFAIVDERAARLQERVKRLLEGAGAGRDSVDQSRLAQEVALLADRSDVSEELTRLDSHLDQFRAFLRKTEPVGRSLDFLLQEMNREINTIGSKVGDTVVTQTVVAVKAELEKIREQVQNVE